jgi:hypothetical protein
MNPENCIEDLVESMNSLGIQPIGQHARSNIYTEKREYRPTKSEESIEEVGTSPEISTDPPSEMGGMEALATINEIIQKLTRPFSPGQRGVESEPLSENIAHEVLTGLREKGIKPITRKTRDSKIIVRVELLKNNKIMSGGNK